MHTFSIKQCYLLLHQNFSQDNVVFLKIFTFFIIKRRKHFFFFRKTNLLPVFGGLPHFGMSISLLLGNVCLSVCEKNIVTSVFRKLMLHIHEILSLISSEYKLVNMNIYEKLSTRCAGVFSF